MSTNDQSWRHRALCNGLDPDEIEEKFFPHPNSDGEAAKKICRHCPVAESCLTFALETGQEFGVWGAMTEQERRALGAKRKDGRFKGAPCGTESGYRRHLRRGEKSCAPCLAGKRLADQLREERKASA